MSNNRASTVLANPPESASASKPRNSRSVSATPLRTPQPRSSSATGHQGTVEKERKTLQQQANTIIERLQSHPAFTADLLPTGLKPITTKQFVSIVSFFMKSVIGNARGNRLANINTDDIAQWLTQIHYPHLQSRSWLKTPNVPHAFTHLVDLMQWLSHYIALDSEDHYPTFRKNEYYIRDHMSNSFLEVVRETFILWNNNKDEDQQQRNQDRLINECVHRRIGVASGKEASRETKKITSEISKLLKERQGVCPKQRSLLDSQQAKQQKLQQDEQKCTNILQEKQQVLQQIQSEFEICEKYQQQLQASKSQLNAQIKQQSMSKDEFNALLELCAEKRNRNKSMRDTNAHLTGIEYKKKLTYSQCLKNLSECVARLNMFVHEVEIQQQSSLQHLCVDTRSAVLPVSLPPIVRCLEEIVANNLASHDELRARFAQLRIDLQRVNEEVQALLSDLNGITMRCASLQERRMQLDTDVCMTQAEQLKKRNDTLLSIEELQKQTNEQLVDLNAKRANGLELARKNEQLLQETESHAHLLIAAKEARVVKAQTDTRELADMLAVVRGKWEMIQQIGANK